MKIISYMSHEYSAGERSSQEANPDQNAIEPWTARSVHPLRRREPDRVRIREIRKEWRGQD
jgi:hypothetical protein